MATPLYADSIPLCPQGVSWEASFPGCQTTYWPNKEEVRVAPRQNRVYVADLNPLIYQRSVVNGQIWNPYEHMQARQKFIQFICTDPNKRTDPYTQPIQQPSDTYTARVKDVGYPEYTSF